MHNSTDTSSSTAPSSGSARIPTATTGGAAAEAQDTPASFVCKYCIRKPFVKEGRWLKHMRTVHKDQWEADEEGLDYPLTEFPPPSPPKTTLSFEDYDRILHLVRPLTSLETRIATTNDIEGPDMDSDGDEDNTTQHQQAPSDSNTDQVNQPQPRHYTVPYPHEPTIVGTDPSVLEPPDDVWRPFRNGYEFKLARWMLDAGLTKESINEFFNMGLARKPPPNSDGSEGECFTSAYTLGNFLDDVDPDLSIRSWKRAAVQHQGAGWIEFRHRSLEAMVRHIFKQPAHQAYMVYMPVQEFDAKTGYRQYSEVHTAEWWWEIQV